MEVPGLGAELELQLLAYTTDTATPDLSHICDLCCSLWQHQILNLLNEAHILTEIMSGFCACVCVCVCVCAFFLGLHLQHTKVPRLGVELELQLLA